MLIKWPTRWRHQKETFSALLALCVGNSPVTGEFPAQRPVTRSFDVSLICALNKRLSKQSWGWWFETPSCSLWHHRNGKDLAKSRANLIVKRRWTRGHILDPLEGGPVSARHLQFKKSCYVCYQSDYNCRHDFSIVHDCYRCQSDNNHFAVDIFR